MVEVELDAVLNLVDKRILENNRAPFTTKKRLETLREDLEGLADRDGHTTDDGKRCVNCKGYFELPEEEYFDGYCPNRSDQYMPDAAREVFYCAECARKLLEAFFEQVQSYWYTHHLRGREDDREEGEDDLSG